MKKLDQLTVTRFFAALSVILFHVNGPYPFNLSPLTQLFASGRIAVTYFFVLSGFVMSLAYFRPERKLDVGNYYLSRFSRIYPVYLLSFLITCFYYIGLMAKIKSAKILASLFLVQAWIPKYALSFNYVAWSLSVEVFFYAVFPLLLLFFLRFPVRKLVWYSILFWGVSIIFNTVLFEIFLEKIFAISLNPLVYLSGFVLGCVAGIYYLQLDKEKIAQPINLILLALSLGLLAYVLIIQAQLEQLPAFITLPTGLLSPLFTLIVLTLALDDTFFSKILSRKWLVLLGDSSYALFILNTPVRWVVENTAYKLHLEIPYDLFYYIYIPFVILFSVFIHLKFELPAREWLMGNRQMIRLFVWDAILICAAIGAAYLLRFGWQKLYFDNWRVFLFTLRVAIPLVMFFLFLFRLYQPGVVAASGMSLARQMIVPILLSGLLLSGIVYWAFISEVVQAFPRSVLAACFVTLFCFTWLSRFLFSRQIVQPIM